jgi:hypothetical protein
VSHTPASDAGPQRKEIAQARQSLKVEDVRTQSDQYQISDTGGFNGGALRFAWGVDYDEIGGMIGGCFQCLFQAARGD